jgi:hypothetical protein
MRAGLGSRARPYCDGRGVTCGDAVRRTRAPTTREPERPRPRSRAELLHVLMRPNFDRADRIGEFWASPERPGPSGELLTDLEEDKAARAVIWGVLREMERRE